MKKQYIKKVVTEQEWLNIKKNTIGGSEAAAILNKSKWLTANDLYNKLALGKEKTFKKNDRMVEGTLAEQHIRGLFQLDFKDVFELLKLPTRKKCIFIRKDKPYISCTPDTLAINKKTGGLWGIEFKDIELRSSEDRRLWESNDLPDQYYCQDLQYFVVFNDMEGVILFAHIKYFKFDDAKQEWYFDHAVDKPFYMYRSDVTSHISHLEKKETEFMEVNIKGHKRPKTLISFK